MKIDENELRTELLRDIALSGLASIGHTVNRSASYQASLIVHRTFEPRRMRYIIHHALPMARGVWKNCGGGEDEEHTPYAFPAKLGSSSSSTLA